MFDSSIKIDKRLSKSEVVHYAQYLHNDQHAIFSLCDIMFSTEDNRIAYNAAWILFHLYKEDKEIYLTPLYDRIADMAIMPELEIRRGLILSILADMPIGENYRTDLLDFCLTKMLDRNESDSTRSVMIKLAAKMCKPFPELINELVANLEFLSEETKPSISAASRKALKTLNKANWKNLKQK